MAYNTIDDGDGITDYTSAVQAMAVARGTVHLGEGVFPMNLDVGQIRPIISGQGMGKTFIKPYNWLLPPILLGGGTYWDNGKIEQLTISGNNPNGRNGTCIQFGHTTYQAEDEFYGRFFFDHVKFSKCEKAIARLWGNIGIWGRGCQFEDADYHLWCRGQTIPQMHAGNMVWVDTHFQSAYTAHLYLDSIASGYQISYKNCIKEANPGFIYFIKSFNSIGVAPGITIEDDPQEGNCTSSSVIIDGTTYSPKFLHANNVNQISFVRSTLKGQAELVNSNVTTTECSIDGLSVTKDADSSWINNDTYADVPGGINTGYTRTIRNFNRVGNQTGCAVIPHRIAYSYQCAVPSSGSFWPKVLAQETFLESGGLKFYKLGGGGVDIYSSLVADGVINSHCQELSVPATSTRYACFGPDNAQYGNATIGKYIAWFLAAKLVSGISPSILIGNNQVYGSLGSITAKTWQTYGCVTYAGAGGSFGVSLDNIVANSCLLRFALFSFVEFDTKQEAIEYLDSRTMAVV